MVLHYLIQAGQIRGILGDRVCSLVLNVHHDRGHQIKAHRREMECHGRNLRYRIPSHLSRHRSRGGPEERHHDAPLFL